MPVIKRYPNRKLYDTEAKQYVTLDGIAEMIRAGQDVKVVDHTTGEDLTTLTLTQIIFEQEKKQSGFLPRSVLTGLVQAGGERLGALRSALAAPLDLLRQVDEEIEARIQTLIRRGELSKEEGARLLDKLVTQARAAREKVTPNLEAVEQVLKPSVTPGQADVEQLAAKLEELSQKLERLNQLVDGDDEVDAGS